MIERCFLKSRPSRVLTLCLNRRREFHHGPKKGDTVVIAMSGGVDSSLSARLLASKDYNLSTVFMRNWDTRDERASDVGCEWEKDWEDVQRVCRQLGIPCEMVCPAFTYSIPAFYLMNCKVDLSQQYWTRVFEPALDQWVHGATPNPDVSCNR